MALYCGFDFGTSNTVVTLLGESEAAQRVISDSSVLFLPDCGPRAQQRYVGAEAVDTYVSSGMRGRFIQSLKTALSDPSFDGTEIFEKYYPIEEILAMILLFFKEQIEDIIGTSLKKAVFGRPVRFAHEEERDRIAEDRLLLAAIRCGFDDVRFCYEPVAASTRYVSQMTLPSRALVCDFGGGTSDFSVIELDERGDVSVLANHGVRVGGDDLEGEIMQHRLLHYFGHGTMYESYGKLLPVPVHIFKNLSRWELIPFIKTPKYREELRYIRNGAQDQLAIQNLIHLIDDDLGYALFMAIKRAKHELSEAEHAAVRFFKGGIELKERILRNQFESYIEDEVTSIREAVIHTIDEASVGVDDIDLIFFTGGSSLVSAIRTAVTSVVQDAEIHTDTDVFNAVSLGLAMKAREEGLSVT